jgi:hypothetical protein
MIAGRKAGAASLLGLAALAFISTAQAGSIRFFGFGDNDLDRVKIRIDDPGNNNPGPPADIGVGDFTIEFWIKGAAADNVNAVPVRCGVGEYGWINGKVVFDRDRFNLPRSFGLSLDNGSVAFGANFDNVNIATHCGTRNVLDQQWHHVAVTRSAGGVIRLFVDGVEDGNPTSGVGGDLSYPDAGQPEQQNNCKPPQSGPTGSGPCINSDPFIVLGAEKHDARPGLLAFSGLIDELRLSTSLRYTANFTPATAPFALVANTAALYHFDEAPSGNCNGMVIVDAAGGASPGACNFGGAGGPVWSPDSPFAPVVGPGTLQFSSATAAAAEGSATVALTVTRTGGSTGAVAVNYASADGSALANNDYTPVNAQLNWANGDAASKNFNITILDDMQTDPGESFTVTLSNPTNGATLGTPSTSTIAITDNDSPGTLQFSAASYPASEGTPTRTITVTRTNGSMGAVGVNYASADGTAIAPGDYATATGTLSWNAGETTAKTFDITIADDQVVDAGESFAVAISGPSGGATLGAPATASVSIADNDSSGGGGSTNSGGGGGGVVDLVLILAAVACLLIEARRSESLRAVVHGPRAAADA